MKQDLRITKTQQATVTVCYRGLKYAHNYLLAFRKQQDLIDDLAEILNLLMSQGIE